MLFRYAFAVGYVVLMGLPTWAAVQGQPKRPYEDHPDDQPRTHTAIITEAPHSYDISFQGTVDGRMTRSPIGYGAFTQGWQPNRSVVIENLGDDDVVNPWITVNGRIRPRNLQEYADLVAQPYEADADRARALWEFHRRHRFHATTWCRDNTDAIKILHVYGYSLCGNEAQVMNDIWKAAGFEVRRGRPIGHCVTEVFYDGAFHLLDSDEHVICLKRDNETIASCAEVVHDHDLIKRTHTYGILQPERRETDEFSASLYSYEGERKGDWGNSTKHTMDMRLRPGESLELRWDHRGKEYSAGKPVPESGPRKDGQGTLILWGERAFDNLRNGRLRYQPDLSHPASQRGVDEASNVVFDIDKSEIRVAQQDESASVAWKVASPYVFVGGTIHLDVRLGDDAGATLLFSADGEQWQTISEAAERGEHALSGTIDQLVSPPGSPDYAYWIRCDLSGDAAITGVCIESDIQTSALMLPELEVGKNEILYTDESPGVRHVRITYRWLERRSWHAPEAPSNALTPEDGVTVDGSKVTFRWSPPLDPDGDKIADYHFELSAYPDMRWPLSPNFEKLLSRTKFRGKAEYQLPYTGLLNPETPYYWRVRAQDARGVWGPWSRPFQFKIRAPGVPLDVTLLPNGEHGMILTWRPNPKGSPPVKYKVYGNNERGFSVSDTDYAVNMGRGFVRDMAEYESKPSDAPDAGIVMKLANLITETAETSLEVVGVGLKLPNTNCAYYRVVAVDEKSCESGPSDYAEVPRPFVINPFPKTARSGKPFRHAIRLIRSDGDLRCRRSDKSSYNAAFWDREDYTFTAVDLPEGLAIDSQTGEITGEAPAPGQFDCAIQVTNQFGLSRIFTFPLTVQAP